MRKIFCSIALGAFMALAGNHIWAQTADSAAPPPPDGWRHGPPDPATETARMAKRLSLTAEQQTQVQAILTNHQAQMKALNDSQTITHQQWITQSKALREQTRTQIEALLTDTQKQTMAQHMHRGPMGDHDGPPPPPEQ